MRIHLLALFSVSLLLFSCAEREQQRVSMPFPEFLAQPNKDLSGTCFFLGPGLDSSNMEILAPCDCCGSNLAFVDDSLFIYESLCLEEDIYSKGNYLRVGNLLILEAQSPSVSHVHYPGPEAEESWETTTHKTNYVALNLSELNTQTVISMKYEEGTDYGLETEPAALIRYTNRLKKEGT
jgi:hypothetical protein